MEKTIVPLNQIREKKAWHFPLFSADTRSAEAALERSSHSLVRLGELVGETARGFPGLGGNWSEEVTIPLLSIQSITPDGVAIENSHKFISSDEHKKLKKSAVRRNDVLVTLRMGSRDTIAAVYETDEPANLGPHLALLRLKGTRLDPHYLVAFLNSPIGRSLISQQTIGSIQRSLVISQLLELLVPVPSLSEQKELVQAIRSKRLQAAKREQEATQLREEADGLVEAFLRGGK